MWRKIASFPLKGIEEGLKLHSQLVMDSIELLSDLIEKCQCYDWDSVRATAEKIAFIEREADDVKRGVEVKLYRGILFVGLKEDFLRLLEAIDQIADRAKEASRALASRAPDRGEMEEIGDCSEKVKEMIYGTIDIVKILIKAIEMINKDKNETLNLAHEIEKYEERLDDVKLEALRRLTVREKKTSPLTYLQIRDFIFLLDMIADAAENASDIITAMIVKSGA
jgi:hypothetical protein